MIAKRKLALHIVATAGLLVAALSISLYGSLINRIDGANQAFRDGNYPLAKQNYVEAASPFHRFSCLKGVLRGQYQDLLFNYVQLLYSSGRYQEVVETLEQESTQFPRLAGAGPYHLWMGNALFRLAVLQKSKEQVPEPEALQTVADEYQRAIELDRDNWDAKHNYEFVKQLLAKSASKKPKDKETLQLMMGEIRMTSEQRAGQRPEKLQ